MELLIENGCFIQIEKISSIQSYVHKLKDKSIKNGLAKGIIEIDISYRDNDNHECFKSIPYEISLDVDYIRAIDFNLKKLNAFLIDNQGINIEYQIELSYENDVLRDDDIIDEIIDNGDNIIEEIKEELIENDKEEILEDKSKEEIEKIKEDISKDYENKLAESLQKRENVIITTKSSKNESDFLRFFDERVSTYFKIKTIECHEHDLNNISKEYNVPIDELIKGYDKINGRVIFKYKG